MCEGLVLHRRKRDMIPSLFVRPFHCSLSSGMTRPGCVLFLSQCWGKHEPHVVYPSCMLHCLYADARDPYPPVRPAVLIGIESSSSHIIVSETQMTIRRLKRTAMAVRMTHIVPPRPH